jgi:hypothetical protein
MRRGHIEAYRAAFSRIRVIHRWVSPLCRKRTRTSPAVPGPDSARLRCPQRDGGVHSRLGLCLCPDARSCEATKPIVLALFGQGEIATDREGRRLWQPGQKGRLRPPELPLCCRRAAYNR